MNSFDPALQSEGFSSVKPLFTLAIFAGLGSFFLGALFTAVKRGIKEEGWFKSLKKQEEKE